MPPPIARSRSGESPTQFLGAHVAGRASRCRVQLHGFCSSIARERAVGAADWPHRPGAPDGVVSCAVTMNAALGGQFSSRLNRHFARGEGLDLRRGHAWTSGAMRKLSCETSVQPTPRPARWRTSSPIPCHPGCEAGGAQELDRAQRSLTGARAHFEEWPPTSRTRGPPRALCFRTTRRSVRAGGGRRD